MNARTLRHDWLGGRAGLGLVGALMIVGLGCGSSPPAAQEPEPEPVTAAGAASEPANEPESEPANEPAATTAPNSPDVAEDAPAAEPEQASVPPAEPAEEPVAEPSGKVLQLIQESEEAGRKGLYGQARRLCSQALEIDPKQPRAIMICAIAACNLGNRRLSQKYYEMAETEERQKQIFQICLSRGIDLRK